MNQEENLYSPSQPSSTPINRASNRKAIENNEDPLDVEPLNINDPKIIDKDSRKIDLNKSDQIEDPW